MEKRFCSCCGRFLVAFLTFYFAEPASAREGQYMSLTIQPTRATQMRADSRIVIGISLKNTSGHVIQVKDGPANGLYNIDVWDATGAEASLTMAGANLYDGADLFSEGHFTALALQPGQMVQEYVEVADVYDLTRPGTYTIQLTRKFDDRFGPIFIRSNVVSVTVRQ
jgi:hypothetical protein